MTRHSLAKDKIRVLLLEGVHENAVQDFQRNGYTQIEQLKVALE
ncbi:hypothetical protein [Elstera litoralis]|nr:hypothetical protein [Elstera litoralis]